MQFPLIKLTFLTFGLQFYSIYNFRSILFINYYDINPSTFGILFGLSMAITFLAGSILIFQMEKRRIHKKLFYMAFLVLSLFLIESILIGREFFKRNHALFWLTYLLFNIFNYTQLPLIDKIVYDWLNRDRQYYGNQKLFDTFGYSLACFIVEFSLKQNSLLLLMLYIFFSTTLALISAMAIRENLNTLTVNYDFFSILKNRKILKLMCVVFLNGIIRTASAIYLYNFYNDYLQLRTTPIIFFKESPISFAVLICTLSEMVIFVISPALVGLFHFKFLLLLSIAIQIFRFFLYLFIHPKMPYLYFFVCLNEFCKGLSFSLFQLGGVALSYILAPRHLRATTLVLFNGLFNSVPFFISGLIFGPVFSTGFSKETFQMYFFILLILNLFLFLIIGLFYYRDGQNIVK